MTENNGFIQIHRQMLDWEWYQDNVVKDVFLHLLLSANFKPTRWQGINLCSGELITSYESLSKKLNFSISQIRTAIKKLKSTNEIATKSTNRYTIITVVNWDKFQQTNKKIANKSTGNLANKSQSDDKQTANKSQQINKDNNVDNENKIYTPIGEDKKPWTGTGSGDF